MALTKSGAAARLMKDKFPGNNPILGLTQLAEPSLVVDGSTVYMLVREVTPSVALVRYESTDADVQVWGNRTPTTGISTYNGFVVVTPRQGDGYFYAIINDRESGVGANYYMYRSTDLAAWAILNGGDPVLTADASTTSYWYGMWNPSLVIIDGTFHLFVEGAKANTVDPENWALMYTYATLSGTTIDFTANRNTDPIMLRNVCPFVIHVPDRNAVILFKGNFHPEILCPMNNSPYISTRAYYAPDNADFSDPDVWRWGSFELNETTSASTGKSVADADLCVLPAGKNSKMIFAYGTNQEIRVCTEYFDVTLNEFYDTLVNQSQSAKVMR